jgi:5-methylcytosine-specific restriction endonuclease McrA
MANPFTHERRRSMTGQRVARIYAMRSGRCGVLQSNGTWGDGCGWEFGVKGDYEVDHIHALEKGGKDDDENCQLLCCACHDKKTPQDHADAGHIRRSFTKHVVPSKFRSKRGFR